jgi:hypothetical protein
VQRSAELDAKLRAVRLAEQPAGPLEPEVLQQLLQECARRQAVLEAVAVRRRARLVVAVAAWRPSKRLASISLLTSALPLRIAGASACRGQERQQQEGQQHGRPGASEQEGHGLLGAGAGVMLKWRHAGLLLLHVR